MNVKIDKAIFELPQVQRSIERIKTRYANSEGEGGELTLWLRVPWEPGQEPITFTSEDAIAGCVPIYDPIDGQLV